MSLNENSSALIDARELAAARADFDALRAKLPDDAVTSLAREVLTRVSRQSRPAQNNKASVPALAEALIAPDDTEVANLLDRYHRMGIDSTTLYLGYLAPAAKRLGEMWVQDKVSLAEVSIGTGRIYGMMRRFRSRLPLPVRPTGKSAFFAAVPGETHTLGVQMATDLYRQEGWQVDVKYGVPHDVLVDAITNSGHLLVGLSAGGIHALPDLARLVLAIRVNVPHAMIMVSGNIVAEAEEAISLIHVDAMSHSYDGAHRHMDVLWEQLIAT